MKKKRKNRKVEKKIWKKKEKGKRKKKHYNPKYFMCRRTMIPPYHLEYVIIYIYVYKKLYSWVMDI